MAIGQPIIILQESSQAKTLISEAWIALARCKRENDVSDQFRPSLDEK